MDRRTRQMMKQMGVQLKSLEDVKEVIIKTADHEFVFRDADVAIMTAMGTKIYQIVGTPEERPREEKEMEIPDGDVMLVMEQACVDEEKAREALKEMKGDLAAAIMKLSG